ncbi:MAG: hypothetical protein FJ147_23535 [Deltaproteobacteria bacterium]|nr:hypothetical protein [Deltaproteobacteria bacterium]
MQLARWLGFCAFVGGGGFVVLEFLSGWEQVDAWNGANSDLRLMGGLVAIVGVLTVIIGNVAGDGELRRKGSPQ